MSNDLPLRVLFYTIYTIQVIYTQNKKHKTEFELYEMKPKFINVILLCSTRSAGSANERYHTGGQLCRVLLNIKIKKCLLTRS